MLLDKSASKRLHQLKASVANCKDDVASALAGMHDALQAEMVQ